MSGPKRTSLSMTRWLCPLLPRQRKGKNSEEELWRQCQKEENLKKKKQAQVHLEQVKKHEHNLEQQKMMLADVQKRLESVSLEVKALRALVAETKEPEGPSIQAPPPCSREPPPEDVDETPPIIDLDMMATPLDSDDDDDMEERDVEPWRTVGSHQKRKKVPVVVKLKGTPASARNGSLRQNFVDKSCTIENDVW